MKASIRRRRTPSGDLADGWLVTRPGYGFGSTSVTVKESWEEARDSLATGLGSGSALTEKLVAGHIPGSSSRSWNGWPVRPRWIEAST